MDRERLAERKQRYVALQEEIAGVKRDSRGTGASGEREESETTHRRAGGTTGGGNESCWNNGEAMAGLQARVDEYERCLQQFQQPLSRHDETGRRLAESVRVLSGYREQLTAKQVELTRFFRAILSIETGVRGTGCVERACRTFGTVAAFTCDKQGAG